LGEKGGKQKGLTLVLTHRHVPILSALPSFDLRTAVIGLVIFPSTGRRARTLPGFSACDARILAPEDGTARFKNVPVGSRGAEVAHEPREQALGGPNTSNFVGDLKHQRQLELHPFGVHVRESGVCKEDVISKAMWDIKGATRRLTSRFPIELDGRQFAGRVVRAAMGARSHWGLVSVSRANALVVCQKATDASLQEKRRKERLVKQVQGKGRKGRAFPRVKTVRAGKLERAIRRFQVPENRGWFSS
jgi:hypothetical protein